MNHKLQSPVKNSMSFKSKDSKNDDSCYLTVTFLGLKVEHSPTATCVLPLSPFPFQWQVISITKSKYIPVWCLQFLYILVALFDVWAHRSIKQQLKRPCNDTTTPSWLLPRLLNIMWQNLIAVVLSCMLMVWCWNRRIKSYGGHTPTWWRRARRSWWWMRRRGATKWRA